MIFLWGGGQTTKDSACSDKGLIASRSLQLYTPSMRPCERSQNKGYRSPLGDVSLESKPFSSTILESQSSSESHKTRRSRSFFSKSHREQTSLESTFQKVDSSTATNVSEPQKDSRILELESGFFEPRKEIRLERLSTKCGDEIHDSSPKAESIVIAIDSIYTTLTPTTTYPNITLESSLDSALAHYAFDLFFASDVLHHLSPNFTQKLLESIAHIPIIIIKDIDSRHIFGHYANALHDLVFNQEKVCKVYPNKLESTLQALGYTTRYHYLPKLWYPHFLLLAYKATK
ncbi:hypothetical protein NYG90_05090 [Helicobacter sp. XJK30-2]|uniref:Uncharacterized protein n=1 Tax=Helicobacter zhangjianzhongii TaxID=2974574 RepID=A0ACC6FSJ8_9HELI|nr:hypothetical protein [Helicobacter sp. XJK30-2]MDL0082052.1 hypothetical protein [Helicobacter sp. XJK30-2]